MPGLSALVARAAVASLLPSSMTRISKSATPNSVSADPVRLTVSAITASSLYAGSTALTDGYMCAGAGCTLTSPPSTDVVDGDVVGTTDHREPLTRPPGDAGLGIDRTRVAQPVVDLHIADAVTAQQGAHRACRPVGGAAGVHGLDVLVACLDADAIAPEPPAEAHHAATAGP